MAARAPPAAPAPPTARELLQRLEGLRARRTRLDKMYDRFQTLILQLDMESDNAITIERYSLQSLVDYQNTIVAALEKVISDVGDLKNQYEQCCLLEKESRE